MTYDYAIKIATRVKELLEPHCERLEIAGSVRRRSPECNDIEIVAIPKPYEIGLFASGIATVIDAWEIVKGELPCKYTQRILPDGTKLDLFFAQPDNWGFIYAIRTGSADFSKKLATAWVSKGYKAHGGFLHTTRSNRCIPVKEEIELFNICGIDYIEPEKRL